jgi:serpin B
LEDDRILCISDAIHRALVEVNGSGTEAAASAFFPAATKRATDGFIADHPFLFLIRDQGSGSILFLGRVVDPSRWLPE